MIDPDCPICTPLPQEQHNEMMAALNATGQVTSEAAWRSLFNTDTKEDNA